MGWVIGAVSAPTGESNQWLWFVGAGAFILVVSALVALMLRRGRKPVAKPTPKRIGALNSTDAKTTLNAQYEDALHRGAFTEAVGFARKLRDPRRIARALEESGDIDRAITAWVDAGDSAKAAALLERAEQWSKAGWFYKELNELEKAVKCFVLAEEFMKASEIMTELGKHKKAAEYEGDALARLGEHMEAARRYVTGGEMLKAAEQLLAAGDIPKAVEALRRAGQPIEAANMLEEQGAWETAAILFEEGEAFEDAARAWSKNGNPDRQAAALARGGFAFRAGRLAFENNDLENALVYLTPVEPLDERYPEANLLLGTIHERSGELATAAKCYGIFLQGRTPSPKTKILFLRVARIEEGIGNPRPALSLLARVITAGLGSPDVTAWAAQLEHSLGTPEDNDGQATIGAGSEPRRPFARTSPGLRGATRMGMPPKREIRAQDSAATTAHDLKPRPPSVLPSDLHAENDEPIAIRSLERRYEFHGRLGQGGNGVVYRATDRALGRNVVVKFLHQALLPTEVARKYFQREAKTAASLSHPNIVTIFDVGQEEDTLFFSMELVEGRTLADVIMDAGGHLNHRTALPIVQQLCAALDYAHERQIIHRDIKPGNIMVTDTGTVKLLDFGLAKALDENPDKSVFLCGTPFYMSPEQIKRDFLDHRTDVYSLGCLLYVIYCGDVPFADGNIFYHHQHTAPPDPRTIQPAIPENVCRVLMQSIAKDRDQRFQRASDVARALADC